MSTKVKNGFKHLFNSLLMGLFSLVVYALIFLLGGMLAGCSTKTEYIDRVTTQDVIMPIKCDIADAVLSEYLEINENDSTNIAQEKRLKNRANIFIYTEELENITKACKGEL